MIEIRIPKEIKDYKAKVFFGLTLRKLTAVIIALAIAISMHILVDLPDKVSAYIIMVTVMPILFIGFFKYNGLSGEQFIFAIIKTNLNPKRMYEEDNIYLDIRNEIIKEELKANKQKNKRKG